MILSKMFHIRIHSNPFIFVLFLFMLFLFLMMKLLLLLLLLKVLNLTPLYDVSYRLCVHSIVTMNKCIGTESMKKMKYDWEKRLRIHSDRYETWTIFHLFFIWISNMPQICHRHPNEMQIENSLRKELMHSKFEIPMIGHEITCPSYSLVCSLYKNVIQFHSEMAAVKIIIHMIQHHHKHSMEWGKLFRPAYGVRVYSVQCILYDIERYHWATK